MSHQSVINVTTELARGKPCILKMDSHPARVAPVSGCIGLGGDTWALVVLAHLLVSNQEITQLSVKKDGIDPKASTAGSSTAPASGLSVHYRIYSVAGFVSRLCSG